MIERASHTSVGRAGSLLILLSVMLLGLTGVIYLADPAAADVDWPSLTIVKAATPADSTQFDFTCEKQQAGGSWLGCDLGNASFHLHGTGGAGYTWLRFNNDTGTYRVEELTLPANWAFVSVSCTGDDGFGSGDWSVSGRQVSVTLDVHQDATCTFTNTLNKGRIIVVKDTDPETTGPSFEFDPSWSGTNFLLADDGSQDSGWTLDPMGGGGAADGYSIAEVNLPAGWAQDSVSCKDQSNVSDSPTDLDLSAGETITCTFVNKPTKGRIIIVKDTDPDGSSQAFEFDPSWSVTNFFLADDGSQDSGWTLDPMGGTGVQGYSIAEVNLPAGWLLDDVDCENQSGDDDQATDLDLSAGETITCTFVNQQASSITVVKEAEGAGTILFPFAFDPPGSNNTVAFNLQAGGSQAFTNLGGGDYEIRDNPPAGWGLLGVECKLPTGADADWGIDDNGDVDVDLEPGQDVTCTFTNTDKGILRVEKVVENDDGGLLGCSDFSFSVDGGAAIPFEADCVNEVPVTPGSHTVTEPNVPAGYTATIPMRDQYDCTDRSIGAGETKTCRITNRDNQDWYWLTVTKVAPQGVDCSIFEFQVGTATYSFEADCTNVLAFSSQPTKVTEVQETGYEFPPQYDNCQPVSFECTTGGGCGGGCDGWGGTCTITNTQEVQRLGRITVDKVTVPADDPQSFDFDGSWLPDSDADSSTFDIDFSLTDDSDPYDSGLTVTPGSGYSVVENPVAGWSTSVRCLDAAGADVTPTNFTVAADQTIACTFTNTKLGTITIVKDAVPDGSASFDFTCASPWECDGAGDYSFSLADTSDSSDGSRSFTGLAPGPYTVSEAAKQGWDLTGLSCNDPGDGGSSGSTATRTATIDLDAGETVTCTFTNTQWGGIFIAKQTLPDGSLQGFEFVGLGGASPPATLADDGLYGWRVSAGGPYTVSEVYGPDGWELYQISCNDGSSQTPSTVDLGKGEAYINVDPGEAVRCTFRNRQYGKIIVDKVTLPAEDPRQFTFNPSWSAVDFTLTDAADPASSGWLPQARDYAVSETVPSGWDQTDAGCEVTAGPGLGDTLSASGFDLRWGQTITCTFENTQRGEIIVEKVTTPGDVPSNLQPPNGFEFDPEWSEAANFFLPGGSHTHFPNLVPGEGYGVGEVNIPAGWVLDSASCTGTDARHEVSFDPEDGFQLYPGEVVSCTFEDFRLPDGSLLIIKDANPNGPAPFAYTCGWDCLEGPDGFSLADQPGSNSRLFEDLETGDYMVTEGALGNGWQFDGVNCVDTTGASVAATVVGQSVTVHVSRYQPGVACTFRNSGYGRIIVNKVTGPAGAPVESFGLDPSWGADFQLSNGQSHNSGLILGGVYSVAELLSPVQAAAGWKLVSASCDDGSAVGAIGVSVGETVTCTFTNLYDPEASLVIRKEASPLNSPDDTLFTFSGDLGAFDLLDGEAEAFTVDPNLALSITELLPEGWELTDVRCTGVLNLVPPAEGESTAVVTVAQNGQGECVFYNQETGEEGPTGSLIIIKDAEGAGTTQFHFDAGVLGTFDLVDGGSQPFANLAAGSYTVGEVLSEAVAEDWEFVEVTCDAAEEDWETAGESVTVNLAEGAVVTCTFVNGAVEGPDLPYTGSQPFTMPLLITGLWALLMGLALWVWSLMRQADKA